MLFIDIFIQLLFSLFQVISWDVRVYTSDISKAGTNATIGLCLYGDKGKSEEILLDNKKEFFEKGRLDTFKIDIPEVGRPYKLRVYHDNKGMGNGWHLNKVRKKGRFQAYLKGFSLKIHMYIIEMPLWTVQDIILKWQWWSFDHLTIKTKDSSVMGNNLLARVVVFITKFYFA